MINAPFFCVGAERSGTTLFRLMLASHPLIAVQGEFVLAVEMLPNEGWPDLEEYYAYLRKHRVFRSYNYDIDESLTYPELVDSFLVQTQKAEGKPIIGAKVQKDFDRLRRIWPDAKFIHLLRDGRDVARSVVSMGWAGNPYVGATMWIGPERTWTRLVATLKADDWMEVRYEDLVADAREVLERVCSFIGVPFDQAMLEYHGRSTYAPPDLALVAQWKRKMSSRMVQYVEARLGDMLEERGYARSQYPPRRVSPSLDRILRLGSRIRKIRFRLARYGFLLWVQSAIARRLGPSQWRDRTQVRMDDIDTTHLK